MSSPWELVGTTLELNGTSYFVESLIPVGDDGIVYAMEDPRGKRVAVKIARKASDPLPGLFSDLYEAMPELLKTGQTAPFINICDRILELDPNSDIATFNRASAFLMDNNLSP